MAGAPGRASPYQGACPSSTVCYIAGNYSIGRSTDGAQTRRISYFTDAAAKCPTAEGICLGFYLIACPSQLICYAGGYDAYEGSSGTRRVVAATKNGGRTWTQHLIPRLGNIAGLSCPRPRVCFARKGSFSAPGGQKPDASSVD
jgi:hypothetical protein